MSIPAGERFQLAERSAIRALELDPSDSRAHASMIQIELNGHRDFAAAVEACEAALSVGQVEPITVTWAVALARALNRLDEAVAIMEYAIARDPLVARYYLQQSINYGHLGMYAESVASAEKALEIDESIGRAHFMVAGSNFQMGKVDNLIEELSHEPEEFARLSGFAIAAFASGDSSTSDQLTNQLVAKFPNSIFVLVTHVFRQDGDAAIQWLEDNIHEANLAQLAETNAAPWFNQIRQNPRWQAALQKVGLSEQQLGKIEFHTGLLDR